MEFLKQCKTCEFNFSGICAGHGDTYKYGETITNDTLSCVEWGASLDYFSKLTNNAPCIFGNLIKNVKLITRLLKS